MHNNIYILNPRFEEKDLGLRTEKIKKTKYEDEFFLQKDCDIHNQRPFFVYKMKIPKKW